MHRTARSIRLACRLLARRPGLAAGRLLTLTLVVAAVAAVMAVANVTLLRPLPFPRAGRLLHVYLQPPNTNAFSDANPLNPLEFERLREQARTFERVEGVLASERALTGGGEPEAVLAGRVSAGFFAVLGGSPLAGRVFSEHEAATGARLVVLGHGLWRRAFGGDRAVIGRTLIIDGEPHAVIGIMNPGFEPLFTRTEMWTPLDTRNAPGRTTLTSVRTVGLLREGTTDEQARQELTAIVDALRGEYPAMLRGWTIDVLDLQDAQYGDRRPAILMLLGAVAALALIAAANIANLTLADVLFRRSDFAVRAALGASRAAQAGPEIAQAVVLAAAGAAAGLLLARGLVPAVLSLDPQSALRDHVPFDWRVVSCSVGAALVVMLLAVVVPVLRMAGPALAGDLTTGSRRAIGGRAARRARIALVVAQTALALVLLSTGALVVKTFHGASRIDPGFDPANVLTAQLRLTERRFPTPEARGAFVEQILDGIASVPGVLAVGTTLNPFVAGRAFQTVVQVEDRPTPDGQPYAVLYRRVSPGYFDAMRIRLLAGRAFDRRDRSGAPSVAIVSRTFAGRFWPGLDPIGRRIKRGAAATEWSVVVGVADDVRDVGLDQAPGDTVYTPYLQGSNAAAPVGLVVRTNGSPLGYVSAIKQAVWDVDPGQPLANVITIESFLSATLGPQRFRAMLVSVFAVAGLLLATVGTYGITARSVAERTRECGVRIALGGRPGQVWWTMAWSSLRAVIAGAVAGAGGSALAAAGLVALLPEVRSAGWTFSALAGSALVAVGAAAAFIAARRATRIDPVRALAE